jgi:hypothetical protein
MNLADPVAGESRVSHTVNFGDEDDTVQVNALAPGAPYVTTPFHFPFPPYFELACTCKCTWGKRRVVPRR